MDQSVELIEWKILAELIPHFQSLDEFESLHIRKEV
jgi:hypothetical protein